MQTALDGTIPIVQHTKAEENIETTSDYTDVPNHEENSTWK
jgi:hypothetical protein